VAWRLLTAQVTVGFSRHAFEYYRRWP